MKDTDPMPWGKHKGKPIGEVPFDYLVRYYKKGWIKDEVLGYVENALKVINASEAQTKELKQNKNGKRT